MSSKRSSKKSLKKRSSKKSLKKRSAKKSLKRWSLPIKDIEPNMLSCQDTSKCFSFNNSLINDLFDYSKFTYYKDPAILISKANGIIHKLDYEVNGYLSSAILKTAINKKGDNLYYEYKVGTEYINTKLEYFPCFVETYALYTNDNNEKLDKDGEKELLCILYKFKKVNDKDAILCDQYNLLIQNIDNSETLGEFLSKFIEMKIRIKNDNSKNEDVIRNAIWDIYKILYQIYSVLNVLKDDFTHYDLNLTNVLIYTIPNEKYVNLTYVDKYNTNITFKTRYIAKIIDYGRCFYRGGKSYLNGLSPGCGIPFLDRNFDANNYYISLHKPNKSHDLLLCALVNDWFINCSKYYIDVTKPGITLFNIWYENWTGMPPKDTNTNEIFINNVEDLCVFLKNSLKDLPEQQNPIQSDCIGTLKIYLDGTTKMEFTT